MIVAARRLALTALVLLAPAVAAAQTYTLSPPPFLLAQNNSGAIINNACVWTYTAGTTTPATTYTTSTGTANTNPIRSDSAGRFTAYLSPGSSYKFVYESACTPPAHGTTLRTADNISATPASSSSVDVANAVAGESITAGQCVYLSAGDASKTSGQWYKCDSANAYSSINNWVGIAVVNIATTGTGTVRLAGSVTGLSSLSIGSAYYAGSAGAITSTAPSTNARRLGEADTATSLIVTANPPPLPLPVLFVDDFRLSLTTATCATVGDVTGASAVTLYFTPCTGNRIALFDTSGNVEYCSSAEVSIAVPATTSQMYDVWAYDSTFGTCTVTLVVVAWTNDTTRATAIARTAGRWTKTGNSSRLYIGNFRTTTVSGQTEDSDAKRYVWNVYNQRPRKLKKFETTGSWAYTTATWRCANNGGTCTNQLDFILGLDEQVVDASVAVTVGNGTGVNAWLAIGLDSTSAPSADSDVIPSSFINGSNTGTRARYVGRPGIGRHVLVWLEQSTAAGTTTWYANNGLTANNASGLLGWYLG